MIEGLLNLYYEYFEISICGSCVEPAGRLRRFRSGAFGTEGRWTNREPRLPRLPVKQFRSFLRGDLRWIYRIAIFVATSPALLVRYRPGRHQ